MSLWGRVAANAVQLLPEPWAQALLRRRHPFDLHRGTDTGGLLYAPQLSSGHCNDQFNEGYYATAPSAFLGLIARWEDTLRETALRPSDFDFVDLGCGKGRVLLLAAEMPFQSVTGIELNAGLGATAKDNLRRCSQPRRCGEVRVVCGDVLSTPPLLAPPDLPLLLFLFNSFSAEVVRSLMDRLSELARRRSAPIDLLYVHPDQAVLVERTPGVKVLFEGEIPFTREDRLADVFGVDRDLCAIYRIQSHRESTP